MEPQPTLTTARLCLRPLEPSDAPRVSELAGAWEVASRTTNIPHPYEKGMAERWITIHRQAFGRGEVATFAVTLPGEDALIGTASLHFDRPHNRAELSYWLGVAYWGRGYASEAVLALMGYGFGQRGLQRITCSHFGDNERSAGVMKKCGFTLEGRQRRHIFKWGEYHDLYRYGILREEFLEQHPELNLASTTQTPGGTMITGIAHICLRVADLERSVKFYTETLGLEPAFDFRRPDGTRFGQYVHVSGRSFIELFVAELAAPAEGQSFGHFCLEVEDIEATVRTLRERGVEVSDVKMGGDNSWQAWLADPDGNRIELHDYTPESSQAKWIR